ncbi:50S ribosomal protein L24 [Microgenomates group bacterium RBG_19FT_COMBO_39_10]|nr:ribosomal protein L24 [uncultured bacterium]OGV89204.1 MAG: 50S ribosomal protein L24 [Microgenomates group bacterium RBG_19FT_COMBO_39_10]
MKLKKGDSVIVLKGKDKGRKGKIEKIFPKINKALIPGINVYKKHARKQSDKKPGGIIEIVKPLPIANVALFCPKCKKPTRVGYRIEQKSGKVRNKVVKARICRKCQTII